jgi:hypothetical protein
MMKAILAALAIVTVASSAVLAQPLPIPELRVEIGPPPPPPGPAYVLEPGHWQWVGTRYVWVGRHWIRRRPDYVHFIPGHWQNTPYGPRWIREHWGR